VSDTAAVLRARARTAWSEAADLRETARRLEDLAAHARPLLDELDAGLAGRALAGPARDRLREDVQERLAEVRAAAAELAHAAAHARASAAALSRGADRAWQAAARLEAAIP
jgi:hypothetical protein